MIVELHLTTDEYRKLENLRKHCKFSTISETLTAATRLVVSEFEADYAQTHGSVEKYLRKALTETLIESFGPQVSEKVTEELQDKIVKRCIQSQGKEMLTPHVIYIALEDAVKSVRNLLKEVFTNKYSKKYANAEDFIKSLKNCTERKAEVR